MDAEVGHEIVMGLASAERGYRSARSSQVRFNAESIDQGFLSKDQNMTSIREVPGIRGAHQLMVMSGDRLRGQGDGFDASCLTKDSATPLMDGDATPEVGKGKSRLAVSPVCGTNEIKERFIFVDEEQLSLTERPADRWEIAGEHLDFSYVRC